MDKKDIQPFEIHRDIRKHLGSGFLEDVYGVSESRVKKICINPDTESGEKSHLDWVLKLVNELDKSGPPHVNNDICNMLFSSCKPKSEKSIDAVLLDLADAEARLLVEIKDARADGRFDEDEKRRIKQRIARLRISADEVEELIK